MSYVHPTAARALTVQRCRRIAQNCSCKRVRGEPAGGRPLVGARGCHEATSNTGRRWRDKRGNGHEAYTQADQSWQEVGAATAIGSAS